MAMQDELVRALLAGEQQRNRLRTSMLNLIERAWTGLGSWRDADIDRFVRLVGPVVTAGQRQMSMLTVADLVAYEQLVTGVRPAVPAIAPDAMTVAELRGVPVGEVYRRPAVTTWTALSDGASLDDAVGQGLTRALGIASTDLQMAKVRTAQQVVGSNERIVGYTRVLEGTKTCGLCAVASTQRYHRAELMPIHGGCDCSVAPIFGDEDPGQVINQDRLDAAHEAILERFGSFDAGARDVPGVTRLGTGDPLQYRDVLIVHEHGEIGPVLAVRGQHFAGPDDLNDH